MRRQRGGPNWLGGAGQRRQICSEVGFRIFGRGRWLVSFSRATGFIVSMGLGFHVARGQDTQTPSFSQSGPRLRELPGDTSDEASLFPPENGRTAIHPRATAAERVSPDPRHGELTELPDRNAVASDVSASSVFAADRWSGGYSGTSTGALRDAAEMQRMIARSENVATLEHYNLKLGPIPFVFGAAFSADFSDNIEGTSETRTSDVILRPEVNVSGTFRLTRFNSISIQLSFGYLKDVEFPDRDRFLPNASAGLDTSSGLSFDIKVGNFLINVHDLPEIPRQQVDLVTQRTPTDYSRFNNTAGLTILWLPNSRLVSSFRYDHVNSISLDSNADQLASSTDRFAGLVIYEVSRSLHAGLNVEASSVTYETAFLNSSRNSQAGLFIDLRATDYLQAKATLGYQVGEFGDDGTTGDTSNLGALYGNLTLTHNINPYVAQQLSVGHDAQLGTNSNFVEIDYIRHQTQWQILKGIRLGTSCFYERANESGGMFAQKINHYGGGISAGFDITRKLLCECQYSYVKRDAPDEQSLLETPSLRYYENRFTVSLRYVF